MIGVKELAERLDVSTDTVRKLVRTGAITYYNIAPPDSRYRTLRFNLDEVLKDLRHEHNGDQENQATERADIGGAGS